MKNKKRKTEKVQREAGHVLGERLEQLRQVFPEVFSEGKIDWEKLRESLGEEIDTRAERYAFSWAGKRDAVRLLQTPSRAALVPAKNESVHFDETENVFIEGDNLEVLKLLYKPYFGRIKMIYIDPPYNTGNDFVYPDNYADPLDTYLKISGQKDAEGNLLTSNPETSGRYHSTWLSMMYPRLFLARQLLREDGVIFVSIDDHEVHNLRLLMNEIFGEENFIQHIIWVSKYTVAGDATTFSNQHEHVLCYSSSYDECVIQPLPRTEEMDAAYKNPDNDPRGNWKATPLHAKSGNKNYVYIFKNGVRWSAPEGRWPRFSETTLRRLENENRIWFGKDDKGTPNVKTFLSEVKAGKTPGSVWKYEDVGHTHLANEQLASLMGKGIFDNPKPIGLLTRCLQLSTDSDDLILDFFSGSCTTAQAVLELNREDGGNRRFIMVQLPEPLGEPKKLNNKVTLKTVADIGKERIRRVIEKLKKENENKLDFKEREKPEDLGFKVFKLAVSNFKPWTGEVKSDVKDYVKQVELFTDPLVDGWKVEHVLYEVAVKEGYGLNCKIEKIKEVKEYDVFRVTDAEKEQSFTICLAEKIRLKGLKPLGLKKDALFICRDRALDDETAANLALQCRLKTI